MRIEPISTALGARVSDLDLHALEGHGGFAELREALDEYSVLVLPSQPLDDGQQMAFSALWGKMEPTKGVNPASGTVFARQSNLDMASGEIIAAGDRRMDYQKGNYQWHADSTFKAVPSLCSILSARIVPPEGGNTEFVSTRFAFETLPTQRQQQLRELTVVHDFSVSRGRVGFEFSAAEAAHYPPVRHPLVQKNPRTGRESLLIGAHAAHIDGWPVAKGAALLDALLAEATAAGPHYSHVWQADDIVIWDNRSVLHRATAYDTARHKRLMQRTTISNPQILSTPAYQRLAASS